MDGKRDKIQHFSPHSDTFPSPAAFIIPFTECKVVIYWEYAFLENFILDGLLLYLSLLCVRAKVKRWKLFIAAAAGGAEAVLFPLLTLPVWCAYLVKLAGGEILVILAGSGVRAKDYLLLSIVFFLLTFALGGMLTAAYSFFGVEYFAEGGYLVESAPVGLIFGGAGIFFLLVLHGTRKLYRRRKLEKNLVDCILCHGGKLLRWKGFWDSGNCLLFRGEPVCVVSAVGAFALFGKTPQAVGRMRISTVNGEREASVFCCEELRIGSSVRKNVFFTVGDIPAKEYCLILNTNLLEGDDNAVKRTA